MALKKTIKLAQEFIQLESLGGILLFLSAVIAIIFDNTKFSTFYNYLLHLPVTFGFDSFSITHSLTYWINEGLMTLFFLGVGLEIKRELIIGELNSTKKMALPGFAALGGMIVPALIYIGFNVSNRTALSGWAIPVATDIAFALGVLRLLGARIPASLKVFLTALTILDDLGAIIIIGVFYTSHLSPFALLIALILFLSLLVLNILGISQLIPYLIVGFLLWLSILKSGIHGTLAGVALATVIPLDNKRKNSSPLQKLEHLLNPWVALVILPVFAFFNAGLSFSGMKLTLLTNTIPLGIIFGLFLGKQIGVFSASWLSVKTGIAKLPRGTNWLWIYGIAILCGIGFTMSLFIGTLAFDQENLSFSISARLGVLVGSLISGITGYIVLRLVSNTRK